MFFRIAIYVTMSLGLLGFGTVAWLSAQPASIAEAKESAPVVMTDTVLVAGRDLTAGALLKPDDISTELVPHDKVPEGVTLDTPANRHLLSGAMLRRRVTAGEALLPRDLLRPGDHGFLAAVLGAGMRASTIGVDAITGSAGLIWPGDRVDVLLTHELNDANRPVSQRVAAETVLNNVRVIAIDQQLVQGAAPGTADAKSATTVTLEVSGPQSERISVAARLGRLSLVVRAARPDADSQAVAEAERTRSKITWAGDVSPALSTGATVPTSLPSVVKVHRGSAESQEYKF